jgi:ABC-type branched-subunit amino acid transport system permease subunit
VLGGLGSISGEAIAAVFVTVLSEWLKDPSTVIWYGLGFTALIAVVAVFRAKMRLGGAGAGGTDKGAAFSKPVIKGIVFGVVLTAILEVARLLVVKYGINLSEYRMILYAVILILVMLLRPNGLFGVKEIWDFFAGHPLPSDPRYTTYKDP